MQVAQTILEQLGGSEFLTMTGSHSLTGSEDTLGMRLRRNKAGANVLRITLNAMDTYDVEFASAGKRGYIVKKRLEGVYCDQLKDIFEEVTGLYVSLFGRKAA